MVFITGGAAQGKRSFAENVLGVRAFTAGSGCTPEDVLTAECVTGYHELIARLMNEGIDPVNFTERFCRENPSAVVIMNEVGSGIVPMESCEREWREMVGRCGCIIAERSETVIRMVCGIAGVIKGEYRW